MYIGNHLSAYKDDIHVELVASGDNLKKVTRIYLYFTIHTFAFRETFLYTQPALHSSIT